LRSSLFRDGHQLPSMMARGARATALGIRIETSPCACDNRAHGGGTGARLMLMVRSPQAAQLTARLLLLPPLMRRLPSSSRSSTGPVARSSLADAHLLGHRPHAPSTPCFGLAADICIRIIGNLDRQLVIAPIKHPPRYRDRVGHCRPNHHT